MKRKVLPLLLLTVIVSVLTVSLSASVVVPYPAVPGLKTSEIYHVKVNGHQVWTEQFRTHFDFDKLPDWFSAPYVRVQQEVHQAGFACKGPLEITVTVPAQIKKASVRPVSRGIKTKVEGNTLTFSIPGPDKLYIEIDDYAPLCLFADPLEKDVPSPDDPNVHYFGPGVHHPGYIKLKDNETLYIAPGAIVYGGIRADSVSNIRITGRGILDGNFEFRRMVRMENSKNITVDGVLFRYGNGWTNTLVNCENLKYHGVKVLSFGPGGDGINPLGSRNVEISDCFLRCTDDCMAIKSPSEKNIVKNILVKDNTMIGYAYSDGITIGYETNGPEIYNVKVQNCDILMARGGSRVDGHSGFSIICDGPSKIHDILFEDIRVEKAEDKLFEINITNGTLYGVNPPGHVKNVTLRNIQWYHTGPIVLKGFDKTHRVQDIVFENCTVAGQPLDKVKDEIMHTNSYVDNVVVK